MNTKTYPVLFDGNMNSNATSARLPIAVYVEGMVDLNEKTHQCVSSDFDMQIETLRYEVINVTLPEWLSVDEWLSNRINWAFLWADKRTLLLPEIEQRNLICLSGGLRYACVTLLSTKSFRSQFRESLRDQLIGWMMTPEESRQWSTPFSHKQKESLVTDRDRRAAERISSDTYYASRYSENIGAAA